MMDVQADEITTQIESTLGHRLDQPTFDTFLAIHVALHQEQLKLIANAATLSNEAFLERFRVIFKEAMEKCRTLLGEERFLKVFGDRPEDLIDPTTFREADTET